MWNSDLSYGNRGWHANCTCILQRISRCITNPCCFVRMFCHRFKKWNHPTKFKCGGTPTIFRLPWHSGRVVSLSKFSCDYGSYLCSWNMIHNKMFCIVPRKKCGTYQFLYMYFLICREQSFTLAFTFPNSNSIQECMDISGQVFVNSLVLRGKQMTYLQLYTFTLLHLSTCIQ